MKRSHLLVAAAALACSTQPQTTSNSEPPPVVDEKGLVPQLVCPGSDGCNQVHGPVRAGAAIRSISPTIETWTDSNGDGIRNEAEPFEDLNGNGKWDGVWLAGFHNGRAAQSQGDDLWARALVFDQGDLRVGLVALDLIGLFHQDVIDIRLAAQDLGLDHVMVATTHNHEGPDTMGLWGPSIGESGYDPAYVKRVVSSTVQALTEAQANARPVVMRVAQAQAPHLINDTRHPKVIDQALTSMQLVDLDGELVATTVFWGNHPEALGSDNHVVTSDYPHYLRTRLEQAYPGAPAIYFSGSLGGLSTTIGITGCPDAEGHDTCHQGSFERAEYVGFEAADAAIQALDGDASTFDEQALSLGVRRTSLLIEASNVKLALAVSIGLIPRALHDATTGARLATSDSVGLTEITAGDVLLQTEVNLVEIGPLAIATIPGELYPELWLVKEAGHYLERPAGADFPDAPFETPIQAVLSPGRVPVIVNNANDALGYIIPRAQWDAVGPYAYVQEGEDPQYGEENSLGPDTAPSLTDAFRSMMGATP